MATRRFKRFSREIAFVPLDSPETAAFLMFSTKNELFSLVEKLRVEAGHKVPAEWIDEYEKRLVEVFGQGSGSALGRITRTRSKATAATLELAAVSPAISPKHARAAAPEGEVEVEGMPRKKPTLVFADPLVASVPVTAIAPIRPVDVSEPLLSDSKRQEMQDWLTGATEQPDGDIGARLPEQGN